MHLICEKMYKYSEILLIRQAFLVLIDYSAKFRYYESGVERNTIRLISIVIRG
jgi:hypothetical protein